jgi:hypothetical protein
MTAKETVTVEVYEVTTVRAELRSSARVRLKVAGIGHPPKVGAVPRARLDPSWSRGRRCHIVPFEEEDDSPFVGMLKVEALQ